MVQIVLKMHSIEGGLFHRAKMHSVEGGLFIVLKMRSIEGGLFMFQIVLKMH